MRTNPLQVGGWLITVRRRHEARLFNDHVAAEVRYFERRRERLAARQFIAARPWLDAYRRASALMLGAFGGARSGGSRRAVRHAGDH